MLMLLSRKSLIVWNVVLVGPFVLVVIAILHAQESCLEEMEGKGKFHGHIWEPA